MIKKKDNGKGVVVNPSLHHDGYAATINHPKYGWLIVISEEKSNSASAADDFLKFEGIDFQIKESGIQHVSVFSSDKVFKQ